MNLEELKTIHLIAKEWVDDNDYSYFSAKFILNADKSRYPFSIGEINEY